MTIRVTITKPGVTDAYGIAMVVGTTYTVGDDFGLSLISQGRASDTDDFLGERVNAPFDEVVYPIFPDDFSPVGLSVDGTSLVSGDGTELLPIGAGLVDTTVTASGTLPITALGRITPVNAAGATTQTLPSAATAWALKPYGVVVLVQRGAGVPSFAAGGGDTLRATSGIGACVQYGMIGAQVQSATEWALA